MSKASIAACLSTGKDDWETPQSLFDALDEEFHFTLDLAANEVNKKCARWCGPGSPRIVHVTSTDRCWCNPPYSRGLQYTFIAEAAASRRHGFLTVMLLPARTDTKAFHAYIWDVEKHQPREGVEVRFLNGRLRFVGAPASAPFPSMVIIFRP